MATRHQTRTGDRGGWRADHRIGAHVGPNDQQAFDALSAAQVEDLRRFDGGSEDQIEYSRPAGRIRCTPQLRTRMLRVRKRVSLVPISLQKSVKISRDVSRRTPAWPLLPLAPVGAAAVTL